MADFEEIHVETRQAVVGYCDVTDFMEWIQLSVRMERGITSFLKKMKWTFRKFRESTGYFSIPIGDGIIAILDAVPDKVPVNVFGFVDALSKLSRELSFLADQQDVPRPGQSRIRVTAGTVYRLEEPPLLTNHAIPTVDYIGEPLNIGSRLLQIRRDLPALITMKALGCMTAEEREKLNPQRVEVVGRLPRGVEPASVQGLCSF